MLFRSRCVSKYWSSVASSSDGTKLVACVGGSSSGQIYTSADSGVTWTPRATNQSWWSVASSADGTKLIVCSHPGQIYTSVDSGTTWIARASIQNWGHVACSADGTKLVASIYPGRIFTSSPTSTDSTTAGTAGSVSGGQCDSVDLQYLGNDTFTVIDHEGYLVVQ